MIKKFNLFQQEHYAAPAFESFLLDAGALCVTSPSYGEANSAGSEIGIEETYEL